MEWRNRNRLLDLEQLPWLLRCSSPGEFRSHFKAALGETMMNDELERQANCTQAIAVGERGFVEAIEDQIHCRRAMVMEEQDDSREQRKEYASLFALEKRAIGRF
jgi:uncharacterized protein YegP (UPF0339 family)